MTWTTIPHVRCFMPLFGFINPVGSVWQCDHPRCGKRWMIVRDSEGQKRWAPYVSLAVQAANEIRDAEAVRMASKEIVDVAWRERRAARIWLAERVARMEQELGLTNSQI